MTEKKVKGIVVAVKEESGGKVTVGRVLRDGFKDCTWASLAKNDLAIKHGCDIHEVHIFQDGNLVTEREFSSLAHRAR